jgi:alanyl aminopeptidase
LPPGGTPWHLPVCVAYDRGGQRAEACGLLEATQGSIPLEGSGCPAWVMPNVDGRGYFRVRYSPEQATALHEHAWPALSWTERRAVFFDLEQAALWGHPGSDPALPRVLSLLPEMLAGGDRFTITDAVAFARALDPFMPDDLRERYQDWLRATFGARARALGLLPAPGDDLDAETNRKELVQTAAVLGRDPLLLTAATAHQKDWRDLPASMRSTILTLLIETDPTFGSGIASAVPTERDQARRTDMIFALARASQPARLTEYLALVLDPGVDIRESMWMFAVPSNARSRRAAADFFRAHEAELMQRIPRDEVASTLGLLSGIFTSDCDASRRDEVAHYVTERFASLPGGKHAVEQSLESLDQCIRAQASLEPELRRWLTSPAGGSAPRAAAR